MENIRLEMPIEKIVQKDDGNSALLHVDPRLVFLLGTVEVIGDGAVFHCQKVIIAIPPSQIGLFTCFARYSLALAFVVPIQFEPILPGYKREMLKHMPIGSYLKFIFTFDQVRLFFCERGSSDLNSSLGLLERRWFER